MLYDAIVIGGSYAGLAAAMQLARARRSVRVIDAGRPRNRLARRSHGVIGHDGETPATLLRKARRQLAAYPTVTFVEGDAVAGEEHGDAFAVTLADGSCHTGRRVVLAIGIRDALPDLPGIAERWGKGVFACPYCHGFELAGGPIAAISTGDPSFTQALLLADWGRVTFFLNGERTLDDRDRAALAERDIAIELGPIARVRGASDIAMQDGRVLPFAGIFIATTTGPSSPIAAALGCAMQEEPRSTRIATSDDKATNIAGVFACGDAASGSHSVSVALGDGAAAGMAAHRSLVFAR